MSMCRSLARNSGRWLALSSKWLTHLVGGLIIAGASIVTASPSVAQDGGADGPILRIEKRTVGGFGTFAFQVETNGYVTDNLQLTTSAVNNPVSTTGILLNFSRSIVVRETELPSGFTLESLVCESTGEITFEVDLAQRTASFNSGNEPEVITCRFVNRFESDPNQRKTRDERMRDASRLFINRRVDNLLSYEPDRARMLRRLQPGQNPVSLKDEVPPLKLGMRAPPAAQSYGQPYASNQGGLFANQEEDDQPWNPRGGQKNSMLSSIMGQLSGATGGANSHKFGTSLSQLRESAAAAQARDQEEKLKAAGLGFAGQSFANPNTTMRPGLDVWVEGHFGRYDDGTGGIDRDGQFKVLYAGADYPIAPGILVGALVQIDDTREDVEDASLIGEVEGTGWMVGPYVGVRLIDSLYFDARAAWGRADNDIWLSDISSGYRTGSFDSDRWLATAKLTGNHRFGAWRLTPEVGLAYGNESYDTYFNSLGQIVDSGDATIGRFTGGAEVGYVIRMRDGSVLEPHVGLKGIWNFKTDDIVVGGVVADTDKSRGRVEGGLLYRTAAGWAVRGAGAYDGIGSGDFDAYSGQLWLNVPLN
jgi:outer membrane autotransporter protein